MMKLLSSCDKYYAPVGRMLVGVFFLLAGINKVMGIAGTAGYIASVGLPFPTLLAWASGLFLIAAGGAMIIGYQTKHAACALATYVVLVTLLFHGPQKWGGEGGDMQQLMFMKNMAILGGLLFMKAHTRN